MATEPSHLRGRAAPASWRASCAWCCGNASMPPGTRRWNARARACGSRARRADRPRGALRRPARCRAPDPGRGRGHLGDSRLAGCGFGGRSPTLLRASRCHPPDQGTGTAGYSVTHISRTVGVRELRQNLSRYLERVKAGEGLVYRARSRGGEAHPVRSQRRQLRRPGAALRGHHACRSLGGDRRSSGGARGSGRHDRRLPGRESPRVPLTGWPASTWTPALSVGYCSASRTRPPSSGLCAASISTRLHRNRRRMAAYNPRYVN